MYSNLSVVVYNDERVLTTKQLAQVYVCSPKQIKQNFNNNKERFVEGKHYFYLSESLLKDFKNKVDNTDLVGKNANALYLWTRRGASRHCKLLGTETAWEMFDALEENYFNISKQLSPMEEMARGLLAAQTLLAQKDNEIKILSIANKQMKPKADYFDALVDKNCLMNFRDTAKELGQKQNQFINWLLDNKFVYRDEHKHLKPYAGYMNYFSVKEYQRVDHTGSQDIAYSAWQRSF